MAKLVVELTDRCNLRCGHCPSGRHGGRGELDPALFARILREIPACGIEQVAFTGGEPTLHSRFAELVSLTAGAGLDFALVTNGWSLPKHLDALLAHRERLRMITLSLDGARETTHDALRGRGSYRRVLQAASVCVLRGLPFGFNMSLTRRNQSEAAELVTLAAGLGALGVRFGHLMSDPNPAAAGLELGPDERKALDRELRMLQAQSDFPIGFAPGGWSEDLSPCDPLRGREFNLDWRGRLGLCCHLSGFNGQEQAAAADLNRVGLKEALAALGRLRDDLRGEKQRRRAGRDWRDDDHFACWYCAKRFGGADWIHARPDHPWHGALTGVVPTADGEPTDSQAAVAQQRAMQVPRLTARGPRS
jgi:MoaA/NifB/PqqE/SkfB family radical SAM enzyme